MVWGICDNCGKDKPLVPPLYLNCVRCDRSIEEVIMKTKKLIDSNQFYIEKVNHDKK